MSPLMVGFESHSIPHRQIGDVIKKSSKVSQRSGEREE